MTIAQILQRRLGEMLMALAEAEAALAARDAEIATLKEQIAALQTGDDLVQGEINGR